MSKKNTIHEERDGPNILMWFYGFIFTCYIISLIGQGVIWVYTELRTMVLAVWAGLRMALGF